MAAEGGKTVWGRNLGLSQPRMSKKREEERQIGTVLPEKKYANTRLPPPPPARLRIDGWGSAIHHSDPHTGNRKSLGASCEWVSTSAGPWP